MRPRVGKRNVGRPQARLSDDPVGKSWMQVAKNRSEWRTLEETYVQQWTTLQQADDDYVKIIT